MESLTFWNLMQISLVMPVLLVLSILLVAFALERFFFYWRNAGVDGKFLEKVRELVRQGKSKDALSVCRHEKGFIPKAVEAQLSVEGLDRAEKEGVLSLYQQRMQVMLSRRLGLFGTLSFISPLLGLLGTVLGVIRSFRDLAVSGSGGPTIVAAGISEALVSTAAGIAVAVTAALVYNYFQFKMREAISSMTLFGQEIIFMAEHKRDI